MEEIEIKFIYAYYVRCIFEFHTNTINFGNTIKPSNINEVFLSEKEALDRKEEIVNKFKSLWHNYTVHLDKSIAMTNNNGETVTLLGFINTFTTGKNAFLE